MLNVCGNSVGVIPIESQSAVIHANAASRELSPNYQPRPCPELLLGKVETATPNISNHRQLRRTSRIPDCGVLVIGSGRCSTESQVTGNHIGPAVDDTIRTIRQRNRIAVNGVPAGLTKPD